MLNLVKELCLLSGVSSFEYPVREFIQMQVAPYADQMHTDAMGNLIVFKKGKKSTGNALMIAAHMDEVGLIIRQITEDGYLKFATIGGLDRRVLLGKKVYVGEHKVPAVVGLKAFHLVSEAEEKNIPKLTDFYLDIGAKDKEEAKKLVALGDYGVFDSDVVEFGNGFLKAKALDDRIGCAIMMTLLQEELPMDCTFAFTVQEEVGCRGAFGAGFSVAPKIALVLETTTASDLAGVSGAKRVCTLGKGPVVPFMDNGSVTNRVLYECMRTLAETRNIPWQTKSYLAGGNDASVLQRSREGVRTVTVSAPVRYLHAPASVAHIGDINHMLTLSRLFIETVAEMEDL